MAGTGGAPLDDDAPTFERMRRQLPRSDVRATNAGRQKVSRGGKARRRGYARHAARMRPQRVSKALAKLLGL